MALNVTVDSDTATVFASEEDERKQHKGTVSYSMGHQSNQPQKYPSHQLSHPQQWVVSTYHKNLYWYRKVRNCNYKIVGPHHGLQLVYLATQ
jgi:hypothetical protein